MNPLISLTVLMSVALSANALLAGLLGAGAGAAGGPAASNLLLPLAARSGLDMRSLIMMLSLSKNGGTGGQGGQSSLGGLPLMMLLQRSGSENILPLAMLMNAKKNGGKIDPATLLLMASGNDNLMQNIIPLLLSQNQGSGVNSAPSASIPAGAAAPQPPALV